MPRDKVLAPGMTVTAQNEHDCIFCKSSTCFWDYVHGPYMMLCSKGRNEIDSDNQMTRTCEEFEDEDNN